MSQNQKIKKIIEAAGEKPVISKKKKTAVVKAPPDRKKILKMIQTVFNEKKCEDVLFLDLEKVNTYLSVFAICTVGSTIQARAVARDLEKTLKQYKIIKSSSAGKSEGTDNGWILMDLGEIIVHIMTEEKRSYYSLEKLWGDASRIKV